MVSGPSVKWVPGVDDINSARTPFGVFLAVKPEKWDFDVWHEAQRLEYFKQTTGVSRYADLFVGRRPRPPTEFQSRTEWWVTSPQAPERRAAFLVWLKTKHQNPNTARPGGDS